MATQFPTPAGPSGAYKTYQISSPASTHWRPATCEEVDCDQWTNGWASLIDESTPLGKRQAHYIRKLSGRAFTEQKDPTGATRFLFKPGQTCFSDHKTPLGRPELFIVRDGDWRTRGRARQHQRAEDWVEDFAEHQSKLADQYRKG